MDSLPIVTDISRTSCVPELFKNVPTASLPSVPVLEPVEQGIFVEGGRRCHVAAGQLDVGNRVCRRDHLDKACPVARRQAIIWYDPASHVERERKRRKGVSQLG